jgi:hypothetical protein
MRSALPPIFACQQVGFATGPVTPAFDSDAPCRGATRLVSTPRARLPRGTAAPWRRSRDRLGTLVALHPVKRVTLQRDVSVAHRLEGPHVAPPPVRFCRHGGASSLLRLASAALPQRAVAVRASAWRELDDAGAGVEHVVRRPLCAPGATLWS